MKEILSISTTVLSRIQLNLISSHPLLGVRDSLYLNYCRESEIQLMLDATKEAWPPGVKFHKTMVDVLSCVLCAHVRCYKRSMASWSKIL